jgi:hypothetical protein
LRAVAGILIFVVGPSMKVDPEEMKQLREEMKDSPLSFLMGGGAGGAAASALGQGTSGGGGAKRIAGAAKPAVSGSSSGVSRSRRA